MVKTKKRPSKWQWWRYEKYKQQIAALNLTPKQYQAIIRILVDILGL